MPAISSIPAHTSASRVWPSGRSGSRNTIRSALQAPAAAITVPSPNGMWNSWPSARLRSSRSTAMPVSTIAASTNENGPNVETISSSAATPAPRCSKFSRRQLATGSERLTSAIARIRVVPEADLVLARLPAQVDLATVAQGGEVDQPALEVTQHALHRLEFAERALQLEERLRDHASRRASTVRGSRLAEGGAGVLVRELRTGRAQPIEPLVHPFQRRIRLLHRVVAPVLGHRCGSPSSRRSASSRTRGSSATSSASRNASAAFSTFPFLSRLSPRSSSVLTRSADSPIGVEAYPRSPSGRTRNRQCGRCAATTSGLSVTPSPPSPQLKDTEWHTQDR